MTRKKANVWDEPYSISARIYRKAPTLHNQDKRDGDDDERQVVRSFIKAGGQYNRREEKTSPKEDVQPA
jgi:hypothetical protein